MTQKRKRAPGAGRKPGFSRKTAKLTMRIEPATRILLEEAAKKNKRSLSHEAEYHLSVSLGKDRSRRRGSHIQALGEMIELLAQLIEKKTDKHWNKIPAFRHRTKRL